MTGYTSSMTTTQNAVKVYFEAASFQGTCEICDEETRVAMSRSTNPRDQVGVTNVCQDCAKRAPVRIVDER